MANILNSNDYIRSLSDYLNEKNITQIIVSKDISYTNSMGEISENQIFNGKKFYSEINSIFEDDNIYKCKNDIDIQYMLPEGTVKTSYTNIIVNSGGELCKDLEIYGEFPKQANDILLDIAVAGQLNIDEKNLGEKIVIDEEEYTIVGIIKAPLIKDVRYSIVSQDYVKKIEQSAETLYCEASNLIESVAVKSYVNSCASLGSADCIKSYDGDVELEYGRYPKRNNEIIISMPLAESIGYLENDTFVTHYRLPDLCNKKYSGIYDDRMNMYDYFSSGVEVVGIYDLNLYEDVSGADILIGNEVYEQIRQDFFNLYYYDDYILNLKGKNVYSTMKSLTEHGYKVSSDSCVYVYFFRELSENIKNYLVIGVLISLLMTLFMMISYIVYNIKDHVKKIGIMRSVGVCYKDIIYIFMYESLFICSIGIVSSMVGAVFVIGSVNKKINQITMVDSLNIFSINYNIMIVTALLLFLISMIITVIPVIRLVNRKSILLINDNIEKERL